MKLLEAQSFEKFIVLLSIHPARSQKHFAYLSSQWKKWPKYTYYHKPILPAGVLIMSLQKLIRHIKDSRLFIVDEVIQVLIDFTSYYNIEIINLLRH